LKIRKVVVVTFFSLSLCQYFIVPQRPIFDLLKWEEINSNQILIHKIGPLIDAELISSGITSFYYSDSTSGRILKGEIFPEVNINNTDGTRLRLYGTIGIALSDRLTIQNEFEFDNKGINDPHFQGVERGLKTGWVGYLQHSSLTYNYLSGHFSIGRGNPYFFNMNKSLLINPNFPPAEYLWWQHEIQWFRYDWGILLLNKIDSLNRFLTFHRYSIKKNNLRIGFTEAVMGSYKFWGVSETGYILPAAVHLETEENRGINTNLMWLVDGMLKWKNWTFYGELLIDDFALDGKSPPQLAGSIGLGRKFGSTLLNLEYTRVNRWTGNYCNKPNVPLYIHTWIERDVPIGHPIGSDAHQVLVNSYYPFNEKMAIELSFSWMEYGGGSVIERLYDWPNDVPCENNFGYNSEPFPSTSDITSSGGTKFYYLMQDWILAEIQISLDKKMPPYYKVAFSVHLD